MTEKNKKTKKNKAFVSMIALLLANIFLAIGLSIFGIVLREFLIVSSSSNSLVAFSSADGGMECALYWDIREKIFSTSTAPTVSVNCVSQDSPVSFFKDCGDDCSRNTFDLTYPNNSCVQVEVKKEGKNTIIKSFGQNSCDTNTKNRAERALQVMY